MLLDLKLPERFTQLIEAGHWRVIDPVQSLEGEEAEVPRRLVDAVFPGQNLFNCCTPPFSTAESDAAEVESIFESVLGQPLASTNQIVWVGINILTQS